MPPSALPQNLQSNEVSQAYEGIKINNIRGRENCFTLDDNGFQIFRDDDLGVALGSTLTYEEYSDFNTVKQRYRQAVKDFLMERLGAEEVLPFTHEVVFSHR